MLTIVIILLQLRGDGVSRGRNVKVETELEQYLVLLDQLCNFHLHSIAQNGWPLVGGAKLHHKLFLGNSLHQVAQHRSGKVVRLDVHLPQVFILAKGFNQFLWGKRKIRISVLA